MKPPVLRRHLDESDLADQVARRLLNRLVELQADGHTVQLCLAGGYMAMKMYEHFADLIPTAPLDPSRLELWWGDERFVPTGSPDRNAGPTLAFLASHLALDPAKTHPMPAADGVIDAEAAANTYAKELGDTVFDITLLGVGMDGHVASIFPGHPSFEPTTRSVIGVSDSPKPPPERVSLTIDTLNRSREVWFIVTGELKSDIVAQAFTGDPALPVTHVHGTELTLWLVDQAAANKLPYYECEW